MKGLGERDGREGWRVGGWNGDHEIKHIYCKLVMSNCT